MLYNKKIADFEKKKKVKTVLKRPQTDVKLSNARLKRMLDESEWNINA